MRFNVQCLLGNFISKNQNIFNSIHRRYRFHFCSLGRNDK